MNTRTHKQAVTPALMTSGRAVSLPILRPILLPIINAAHALHNAGFVHRNTAPDNIIVRKDDCQPVLIDFGVAGRIRERTGYASGSKIVLPTIGIMKRYFSRTEASSPAVYPDQIFDIYSLGALLYFALTGKYSNACDRPGVLKFRLYAQSTNNDKQHVRFAPLCEQRPATVQLVTQ